ncbi:MAG: Maf family nucleotide pyrophosphatase [Bacteroidia bacterium]
MNNLEHLKIILASKSPRRQELIKGLELNYSIASIDVDESFPEHLQEAAIAEYLAQKKANAYNLPLKVNEILLTADTIVWINNKVLNKPENEQHSFEMLKTICGNVHTVFTGVCLKSNNKQLIFSSSSKVYCSNLSDDEIWHYIKTYKPFDKAGSYGIQDWFGYTSVYKIEGCFYNIMGLPINELYKQLKTFCTK